MSHTEFKALLKKINLKPKGVKEIVLEVSDGALHGKIDMLSEMLDGRVAIAIDSEIVRYNVQINTRTEKPIKSYKVDEQGVVSEIKPESEQMEMDLGLAKQKEPIANIPEEISREVVDEFILSGLAPQTKGFYRINDWIERIANGDTYLKLANEYGMSSGRIVDLIDDYRREVAPLAAKWDEWRKAKDEQSGQEDIADPDEKDLEDEEQSDVADESATDEYVNIDIEDGDDSASGVGAEEDLSDWEKEIMNGGEPESNTPTTVPVDVETIILTERPQFEDIPYDFPTLLERKQSGETWMDIANSIGTRSTVLSAAWTKYKKRISESRGGAA
ncbi:hypothetical protein [Paenibacillus sp. GXUN7292]|uniref:hypothetical protein n=1 Tax=Paenibacillus sp. GXUN7292 TaxID=3422499 RepID=UPI003D7DFAB1